jgi:hypothetical protein
MIFFKKKFNENKILLKRKINKKISLIINILNIIRLTKKN